MIKEKIKRRADENGGKSQEGKKNSLISLIFFLQMTQHNYLF